MDDFSVLISVYSKDNAVDLTEALQSVFSQTLPPTEVILVKDGCVTVETEEVIENYQKRHSNLKVVVLPANLGLGKALNIGLLHCSNDIVVRMDADDICFQNRFELQVSYLYQHSKTSVLGGNLEEFEKFPGDLGRLKRVPLGYADIKKYAVWRNPINHPSVAFRKSAVISAGSYLPMPLFEDYYLWLRMLKKGFIVENLNDILLYFRGNSAMVSRRHGFSYLRKELYFIQQLKKQGLISAREFYTLVLTRLPLRLLPKKMLSNFYNFFLRK